MSLYDREDSQALSHLETHRHNFRKASRPAIMELNTLTWPCAHIVAYYEHMRHSRRKGFEARRYS